MNRFGIFCLFLLLIKFRPKKKFDGQVLGLYFLGYALGRVWIEGLRTDQLMIGPFAVSQLLSGVLIICAAVFLIRKGKQEKGEEGIRKLSENMVLLTAENIRKKLRYARHFR